MKIIAYIANRTFPIKTTTNRTKSTFDPKLPGTMRSFAIVLLATAVLALPPPALHLKIKSLKKQDKRSLSGDLGISTYGYPNYGLSNYGFSNYGLSSYGFPNYSLELSGYSTGLDTKVLGSKLTADNSLASSAYVSRLGTLDGTGVVVDRSSLSTGLDLGVHHQVLVLVPQPIPIEITKYVSVPQPVPVKVDHPYLISVPHPVEVPDEETSTPAYGVDNYFDTNKVPTPVHIPVSIHIIKKKNSKK